MSDCSRRTPTGRLGSHYSMKHLHQVASGDSEDVVDTVNLRRSFRDNQGKIVARGSLSPVRIAAMIIYPAILIGAVVWVMNGGLKPHNQIQAQEQPCPQSTAASPASGAGSM